MAKSITIVGVSGIAPVSHAQAIHLTAGRIPHPCKMLLVAPYCPPTFSRENHIVADEMAQGTWSFATMQNFIRRRLWSLIDTDVAIIVHWDGYALNEDRWMDEFLEYDYIGAPWPKRFAFTRNSGCRVGNGGFSLRSKRWLEVSATLPDSPVNEDFYASCIHRKHFEACGCRVAPLDIAMRWSMEYPIEEYPHWTLGQSFGFHSLLGGDRKRAHLRLNPNE